MVISVSSLLRRVVQTRPRDLATVFGARRQTWAELQQRVARLAGGFKTLGIAPNDRVALLMNNSDRYLEACIAISWAGGVVTPLNGRWSVPELADTIEDSTPTILIVDDANLNAGRELRTLRKALGQPLTLIYSGEKPCPPDASCYLALAEESDAIEDAGRIDEDLYAIFYTGGTTGRSKGVMLSQSNVATNVVQSLADGHFAETSVYLNMLPTFHLSSLWPYLACVASGARSIVLSAFVPEDVLAAIAREKVTEVLLVPTMIQMLIEHPKFTQYDTSSLRRIIYGAAPITEALFARATAAFPETEFVQIYGMTELAPLATTMHYRHLTEEGRKLGRHRSVGRAIFGLELEIVDEAGNVVPRGTVGEIRARGPNRMQGYWNRPTETKIALRDGWMHTGDGGYMDDEGFVYLVDRIKDMIISGGENIYSVEVENCVTQHPAVAQCAVIGVPDEKWGERVHACVILKAGQTVAPDELINHSRARIAHYKCPRTIEFRDAFPLSGAGKVLKRELRREYDQRA